MTKVRTRILAGAAVGVLGLGVAGVAVADTGSPPSTANQTTSPAAPATGSRAGCAAASVRLQALADVDQAVGLRLGVAQKALAAATAKGNQTRIDRLQRRTAKMTARQSKLEARITAIEQRCNLPAPTRPPG